MTDTGNQQAECRVRGAKIAFGISPAVFDEREFNLHFG